jgi:hypothetical protein
MITCSADNQQNISWQDLRQKLILPPPASSMADTIDIQNASELVEYHDDV